MSDEIEARVAERSDLVERVRHGDTEALTELIEVATGADVSTVKVTRPF